MEKVQNPITNPELIAAIEAMQQDNSDENVNKMIDCVMRAKFITPANISAPKPVAKTDSSGSTVMQQETQVQFQLIENQNGEKFFPAFTDNSEKEKWKGSQGKDDMALTFDDYAQMLADPKSNVMGFVINPFGRSVAFPKPMVKSFAERKAQMKNNSGLTQQTIGADEKFEIGDPNPEEYPIDLMAAVINALQERDDVNSAYLRMFKRENDEKPSYLVIVDFDGDSMEEIFKQIATAANPHLNGYQLSMMPYSVPFARKAADGVEPFYTA